MRPANLEPQLGNKQKQSQNQTNGAKLAESVEKMTVEDVPKVKSKNLNVVEEFKKSGMKRMANFVVIGKPTPHTVLVE